MSTDKVSKEKYVKMSDGSNVKTAIISTEDELALHLPGFLSDARLTGLFIGFDTEWMFSDATTTQTVSSSKAKIALLKLCNNNKFCLLIELHRFEKMPRALVELLAIRDIIFAGVNISKELKKLKKDYGLEIRSSVELTTVVGRGWNTDRSVVNPAKADSKLDLRPWRVTLERLDFLWTSSQGSGPNVFDEERLFWLVDSPWDDFGEDSKSKQLEYAVFSAYAAVSIANKLFEKYSTRNRHNAMWLSRASAR